MVPERMRSLFSVVPSGAEGHKLSGQERRVLALAAAGKTNKEITAALALS